MSNATQVKANGSYETHWQTVALTCSGQVTPTLELTRTLHPAGGASDHRSSEMRGDVCPV